MNIDIFYRKMYSPLTKEKIRKEKRWEGGKLGKNKHSCNKKFTISELHKFHVQKRWGSVENVYPCSLLKKYLCPWKISGVRLRTLNPIFKYIEQAERYFRKHTDKVFVYILFTLASNILGYELYKSTVHYFFYVLIND